MSMSRLNLDILYEIVEQVARLDSKSSREILLSLALVCRTVNDSIRPFLFNKVYWPHPNKHDAETGLLFFPAALWPYFRTFHLDWPDHWPDTSPPKWGEKPGLSVYYPKHLDKLEDALPRMPALHTFQFTCPFDPPTKLLHTLVRCPGIKDLRITDTPLYTPILPFPPNTFALARLTLTAVGEAVRIGEGPYDRRFQNIAYFTRGYRRRYMDVQDGALTGGSRVYAAQRFVTALCRPEMLTYLLLSAAFLDVDELWRADVHWPCLATLVLTGPPPYGFFDIPKLLKRTPALVDLRVLLSTATAKPTEPREQIYAFALVRQPDTSIYNPGDPAAYAQLASLAISNAYITKGVLRYTRSLVRLAVCTIISPPRMPIALRRAELEELFADLEAGGGGETLRQIRLISEEELDVGFFLRLGRLCPALETVEVERCGYQEAQDETDWPDWGDAFSTYDHLRELRVALPFLGCEELGHEHAQIDNNNPACIRAFRRPCAVYLAERVPTLVRIGLEYRARTMHRYEDRWLDYAIVRRRDGEVDLAELAPSWYRFPEVYEPEVLHE